MTTYLETISCVIVGDGNVGKSSLIESYKNRKFITTYSPTIFDCSITSCMIDGQAYNVSFWDTAGQHDIERFKPIIYTQADIFILVFSIDSQTSFLNMQTKWEPGIREIAPTKPVVVVGSKLDLRPEDKAVVMQQEGRDAARRMGAVQYFECSALSQENLVDTMEKCLKIGRDYKFLKPDNKKRCCSIT